MERSNDMKPFRIGTMCQLIEVVCHSTQLADEVCLLYGQSLNDISFIKNISYKLTYGYSCAFGFAFERIVILRTVRRWSKWFWYAQNINLLSEKQLIRSIFL